MTEMFANRAVTTLNGVMDNSTTSFVVTSASGFPTSGNFRIVIGTELMLVTSVSSNTFTVTRAIEGTTAISHADRSKVSHVLTAGALNGLPADFVLTGTYANLPTSGFRTGRIYLPTNSPYTFYDNGSSWVPTINGISCTIPNFSGFTWLNQGSGTTTTTNGYTYLSDLTTTNNSQLRILKKAAINATSYTVTVGIIPLLSGTGLANNTHISLGMVQRNSSSGKIIVSGLAWKKMGFTASDTQPYLSFLVWDYNDVSTATLFPFFRWTAMPAGGIWWLQMRDDGTSRYYNVSFDGVHFSTYYKEARTSFITPDEYGVYVDADGVAQRVGQSIVHFSETTP